MAPPGRRHMAIVGIAAQLPSGVNSQENLNPRTFWKFLLDRQDAFEKIPQERLDQISGNVPSPIGTFLKDPTKFDNVEFGIAMKDALSMTATTRRLIESTFLACLDSGIDSRGKRIGVFNCGTNVEGFDLDNVGSRSLGTTANTLANRPAFILDFTGPSLYVDTACSSTLTAMHLAIRSIESGDCDAAVVGGCQHNTNLWDWWSYSNGGVLSNVGKSQPFDSHADGLLKGEGAVSMMIKPLDDALADHDHIYAVILGTSINSSGSGAPLHAPCATAQHKCIRDAFADANRDPTEVDFVELHATGTAVGDPIEANAAGEIFAHSEDVVVGSVKGNLGHLESTAFLASLLKVCLMLEHKIIPPNANINDLNPNIMWEKYQLKVPTEPMPLECRSSTGRPLVALSSSGIGGANGHMVVESAPNIPPLEFISWREKPVLFIVGGLSPRAAKEICSSVVDLLNRDSSKETLSQAVTHSRRARQLPWRTYFTYTPQLPAAVRMDPVLIPSKRPPIVFVFTGQGPQHINMGRDLFATFDVFRKSILEMDKIYENFTGASLIKTTGLFEGEDTSLLPHVWSVEITSPAMAIIEMALFDLLISVGVKPDILVGHSMGETPLLYASGACSKAMAVEVAIVRGQAMKITEIGAGMAAVSCGAGRAALLIEQVKSELDGVLEIACLNTPNATVLSGSESLVEKAVALAQQDKIFASKLKSVTPGHTSIMEKCRMKYESGLQKIFLRNGETHTPALPTYTSVGGHHGKFIEQFTTEYLWNNVRRHVAFHQAITSILQDSPSSLFVEISPHPALSSYVSALSPTSVVTCPMRRLSKKTTSESIAFTETLGLLSTNGINSIDLTSLYGRASRNPAFDINYPFIARHFPLRVDGPRELLGVGGGPYAQRLKMNAKTHPDLAEHVINGEPMAPAAAFVDMVLQTGARFLWDLDFRSILSLASETPIEVRVEQEGSNWTIKSAQSNSRTKSMTDERLHATGFSSENLDEPVSIIDIEAIFARLPDLEIDGFYEQLKPLADFGPGFQRLRRLSGNENEAVAELATFAKDASTRSYCFHPVTLDACLHYALHPDILQNTEAGTTYLPRKLRKFAFYEAPNAGEPVYSYFVLKKWTPENRWADITVCNKVGSVLCKLEGLELHRVSSSSYAVKNRFDLLPQPVIINAPAPQYDLVLRRDDKDEIDALCTTMDRLAMDIIKSSLEGELVVGEEIDRQRYYAFAKSAIDRVSAPLPPASKIEHLRSKFPVFFEVINRLAQVHKDVFKSPSPAVQTLFSDDILNRFYSSGYFSPLYELAVDVFQETISTIANHGKRVIRVLEVGAGTGVLTRRLCDSLKQRDDIVVQYVVTDASFAHANSAAKSAMYKYASAKAYDLSKPPESQGLTPGSFDMVVCLHALHTTQDILSTLSFVRQLIVGGGFLLAIELDKSAWQDVAPGCLFYDFVFGSLPEWFEFIDGRDHCSLTPGDWDRSLRGSGYETVQSSTGGSADLIFTARKVDDPGSPRLGFPSPFFLTYKYGHEMELRREISRLDVNQRLFLWLLASDGVDGAAAMGLVQCLVLEFSVWDIHLAIFEGTQDESDRIGLALRYQEYLDNDTTIRFSKDGLPHVFKVIASPPPLSNRVTWADASLGPDQEYFPPLEEYQVAVNVSTWSHSFVSWRGFVGYISQTKDKGFSSGDLVIGVIVDAPVANRIICHSGQLTLVPSGMKAEGLAEYALTMVITAIALGPSRTFYISPRRKPVRILLAAGDELAQILHGFLKLLQPLAHVEIDRPPSDTRFDWILVDSRTVMQRPEVAFWRGNLLIWDKVMREMSQADPGSLGCSLQAVLQLAAPLQSSLQKHMMPPKDRVAPPFESLAIADNMLFDRNKSYILLGGASDFGIRIALWMYKRGARYIVLTSRRGRKFFEENPATATRQRLSYMESREDLILRVAACNATSVEATSDLIGTLGKPLGGCLSMTVVLSDALFLNQTDESFRSAYNAKFNVFKTFEVATSIKKLDFFVQFSSISSFSGNYGQSNYAMANSLTDSYLDRYDNAFSLIIPAISGVGSYARIIQDRARNELTALTISPEEFCAHLEDGLLKLSQGTKCSRYIFDMPWDTFDRQIGLPKSAQHLISFENKDSSGFNKNQDRSTLIDTVLSLLDVSLSDFSTEVPIVAYGLDSLSATRISDAIRPYANVSQMQLLGGMTWKQLEERIMATDNSTPAEQPQSQSQTIGSMLQMVEKYSKDFAVHRPSKPPQTDEVVLVTGTTGSVGSNVLSELVQLSTVRLVYAINRRATDGTSLPDRQKHSLATRGLDPTIADSSKVVLIEADLDLPDLGLTLVLMEQIRSSVTHIIHTSWMVNWTYGLDAYESNIRATRYLIDLALSSPLPTPPRIVFTSSIGVLAPDQSAAIASPERFLEPNLNIGFGYSESKWVAERLFELVALTTPLRPIVVRTAQVSGGLNGYWKPEEWMPSIVESAMTVKCLPAIESGVSWVPLDIAAKILAEMRNSSEPLLHLAHPHPVPWNTVFGRIASTLNVDLVSYPEWLARLEAERQRFEQTTMRRINGRNAKRPTAFQLIDVFYRIPHIHSDPEAEALLPKMSTEIAQRVVPSLGSIRKLSNHDVDKWMAYWKSIGRVEF